MECFSGVKTAQNSKTEGGIERKNHENVKLKEDVPGEIASSQSQKNHRVPRITTAVLEAKL